MQKALQGYWNLFKQYGLIKTLRFFYSWYYGQYKLRGIDLTKEHIVEVNGYKLCLIPNDPGISTELLKFKTHEPITTKLISKEIKKGMVCIDIGGNIGYYASLESNLVGSKGRVIAFEPSPQTFSYLKKNLELQSFQNSEPYNIACGNEDGYLSYIISSISNACRVMQKGESRPSDAKEIIKVQVKKLDTLIEELSIDKFDFLRMDIEGYEYQLFEGAKKSIKKFKPMIQIEVHPSVMGIDKTRKFLEFLKNEGYEVEHYILGRFETPLVGTMKDVKRHSIDKLLKMLRDETLPHIFLIFIKNRLK